MINLWQIIHTELSVLVTIPLSWSSTTVIIITYNVQFVFCTGTFESGKFSNSLRKHKLLLSLKGLNFGLIIREPLGNVTESKECTEEGEV